ncbi:hypothetical protein NDU88_004938 [Pleurodeles waltl]|uniref:Uncharacterized protein n=1 Tax=Pleurodeles waltl TaxID=8319 RepID=A0AAV7TSP0_PLEWA|nr:hypothetical protein NDU88_004938 [Pleurodeles waltl]
MEVGVVSLNHDGSISEDDDVSLESRGTGDREFATVRDISSIGGVEVSSEEGVPFSRAFSEEDKIYLFRAFMGIEVSVHKKWRTGGSSRVRAGDGGSSKAGARDEAPVDYPRLGASKNGKDGGQAAPRGWEPGMAAPPRLRPEVRLQGGGDPVLLSTRSGRGGQPAGSQAAGSGMRKSALGCLKTDGGRASPHGQEPEIAAPPRLGLETRLLESGDLVQRLSHPAERGSPPAGPWMQKSTLDCLSAKAVRLREQARRRGPGRRSILCPRTQGSLTSAEPSKPRPGRQGPGRSSVGGAPEGKRRSGFTLKSDPDPLQLLDTIYQDVIVEKIVSDQHMPLI